MTGPWIFPVTHQPGQPDQQNHPQRKPDAQSDSHHFEGVRAERRRPHSRILVVDVGRGGGWGGGRRGGGRGGGDSGGGRVGRVRREVGFQGR